MQSGITASTDLKRTFDSFQDHSSLFALPVTIEHEQLVPLTQIAVAFSSRSADFNSSLPQLEPLLQAKTPMFIILRKSQSPSDLLTAVTYIPSNAPVRQKTLFASTRATLTRELGIEKFDQNLFVTEPEEILDPKSWDDHNRSREAGDGGIDDGLLSTEERELQSVKRAEEESRHGTQGRNLMGTSTPTSSGEAGGSSSGLRMKIGDTARMALQSMGPNAENRSGPERGKMVQLGIDVPTETLMLISSAPCIEPGEVMHSIPQDKPSYTFYHYPTTGAVVFIYACPASSKVKEKMLYASTRSNMLELAKAEGVEVVKRLEVSEAHEVDEGRLREELQETVREEGSGARQGFARPKRPGKR